MSLKSVVFSVTKSPFAVISFKARAVRQMEYKRFTN